MLSFIGIHTYYRFDLRLNSKITFVKIMKKISPNVNTLFLFYVIVLDFIFLIIFYEVLYS